MADRSFHDVYGFDPEAMPRPGGLVGLLQEAMRQSGADLDAPSNPDPNFRQLSRVPAVAPAAAAPAVPATPASPAVAAPYAGPFPLPQRDFPSMPQAPDPEAIWRAIDAKNAKANAASDRRNAAGLTASANVAVPSSGVPGQGYSPAAPVTVNDLGRAFATGVPIVGGTLNTFDAATNAALAPVLNRFFDEKGQLQEPTFGERYAHAKRDQNAADKRFATEHPVVDTIAQAAGNVATMAPVMSAAPKAFGLAGPLWEMPHGGAIAGAAMGGADAATRGENPLGGMLVGGLSGGGAGLSGQLAGKAFNWGMDRVWPLAAPRMTVNPRLRLGSGLRSQAGIEYFNQRNRAE